MSNEQSIEEEIARELYRCLYPGSVDTPDRFRTPESDAAEFDRAYEVWDAGREGRAPGIRCREYAARLMPLVRRAQAEAWDEGFDAHEADWQHHNDAGWGDEDCLDVTCNPYTEQEVEHD